jgi:hypothetical protein
VGYLRIASWGALVVLAACSGAANSDLFPDGGTGTDSGGRDGTAMGDGSGSDGSVGHEGGHPHDASTKDVNGNDGTTGMDASQLDTGTDTGTDSGGGCMSATDCPMYQSCDPITNTCGSTCDAVTLCNGGCCDQGTCAMGGDNGACGNGGDTCNVCSGGMPTCAGGACIDTCGGNGNGTCDQGFCCAPWGHCIQGGADQSCGDNGTCQDCTTLGQVCTSGVCMPKPGCNFSTDCPLDQACNTTTHQCAASCGGIQYTDCNGGCCSGLGGQCQDGTLDGACGSAGYCTNCTSSCNPGPKCNGQSCGCTTNADCMADAICGLRKTCNAFGSCQ